MKKYILIFGSTGNVGSYMTDYMNKHLPNEYQIIAIGSRETNFFDKFNIKYIKIDITNKNDFEKLPKDNVHCVIFLSATIPSYMNHYDPSKYIKTNTLGAINILEYCKQSKVDRILYSQTIFDVYNSVQDGISLSPFTKNNFSYKGDHAVYVISKCAARDLIQHYSEEYGLKSFIFRFPTIYNYSPYHYYYPNNRKTIRPIYKMISDAMTGKPLEIWGNPNYSKDMVYVADCSQMFTKAILTDKVSGGIYNVGTGIPVSIEEQILTIRDVFCTNNNQSKIVYLPEKTVTGGFLLNIDNAIRDLDYHPKYSCKDLFLEFKKEMELNRFKELLDK